MDCLIEEFSSQHLLASIIQSITNSLPDISWLPSCSPSRILFSISLALLILAWWTVWRKPRDIGKRIHEGLYNGSQTRYSFRLYRWVMHYRCDNVSTQGWTIVAKTTCIQARLHACGTNGGSFDGSWACYITPWFSRTAVIARLPLVSSHRAGTRKSTKDRWAATWQNQQSDCAPSEDSDQPGHPPSLISLRCALNGYLRIQAFFMRTAKTLIRLGGCPGWSESSMREHSFCWFVMSQLRYRRSRVSSRPLQAET